MMALFNQNSNDETIRPAPTASVLAGLSALRARVVTGETAPAPVAAQPKRAGNAELLQAARHGKTATERDRAAEELRRRVKTLCAAALDRYTSHLTAQEADDLTQDVLMRLLCAASDEESAPVEISASYIGRVAVNLLIDKRRSLDRRGLNKLGVSVDDCEAAIAIPDPAPIPADQVADSFHEYQLQAAIQQMLSPTEAKVVWLRVAGDLSHAEIADELGIKEANARKHYERGLKRLRTHADAGAFAFAAM